jgi:hypothetical protein
MFVVTLKVTRENTTIPWGDPSSDDDLFLVLSEAAKRNITVVQLFSPDQLSMRIVWTAPSEDIWEEFSNTYLLKDGKIDESWWTENNMLHEITKENVNG